MREDTLSIRADIPAEALWDFLADYDNVVRLGWSHSSAEPLEDPDGCRVRYRARTSWEGLQNQYTACLMSAERPQTLTWSTNTSGSRSWLRFDLQPLGQTRTHVTATLHLKHGAALALLEPFAWGLMRSALVKTMTALESLDAVREPGTAASPLS